MTFIELEDLADAEKEGRLLSLGAMEVDGSDDSERASDPELVPHSDEEMNALTDEDDIELPAHIMRLRLADETLLDDEDIVTCVLNQLQGVAQYPGDEYADPPNFGDRRWRVRLSRSGQLIHITDRLMNDTFSIERLFVDNPMSSVSLYLTDRRWALFLDGALNDDAVVSNMRLQFEEVLNDPETGLLDPRTDPVGLTRWRIHMSDNDIMIVDQLPSLDAVGYDPCFRLTRGEVLDPAFDIGVWIHEEIWVRNRILSSITGAAPYRTDRFLGIDDTVDPMERSRWRINCFPGEFYYIRDRFTDGEFYIRRPDAFNRQFDIAHWMFNEQEAMYLQKSLGYPYTSEEENPSDDRDDEEDPEQYNDERNPWWGAMQGV